MNSTINAKLEDYSAKFADLMRYANKSLNSFSYGLGGKLKLKLWSGEKEFKVMRVPLDGDGYIIRFDGNMLIAVSTNLDLRGEKITLAHEAAHLLRMDSNGHWSHNHAVEISTEKLAREIVMPKWKMPEYAEMEHNILSARKIAEENSIPVDSALARLTYDTNTWGDVGLGIYTTYGGHNSYRSFITSPYPVDDSYYSCNKEVGYIGSSFNKFCGLGFEFPETIHISAGLDARYRLSSWKEVELGEPANWLIRNATRNFPAVASGIDQSASIEGFNATACFEPSMANSRNVKGMPKETCIGNTIIMIRRED
ncbi:ImmA/IrrE family metallo-endopeptidase [Candidatus Marsarchaeota archaeon]|nr:ImmA/IrrE family metallo-endopeptidase [Candidatus Marsarchaeota archaeon]